MILADIHKNYLRSIQVRAAEVKSKVIADLWNAVFVCDLIDKLAGPERFKFMADHIPYLVDHFLSISDDYDPFESGITYCAEVEQVLSYYKRALVGSTIGILQQLGSYLVEKIRVESRESVKMLILYQVRPEAFMYVTQESKTLVAQLIRAEFSNLPPGVVRDFAKTVQLFVPEERDSWLLSLARLADQSSHIVMREACLELFVKECSICADGSVSEKQRLIASILTRLDPDGYSDLSAQLRSIASDETGD